MASQVESSDLIDLWQEAMATYTESVGQDIRELPHYKNITDVMSDAQLNAEHFNSFRHPPGSVNRLRTCLNRHVDIIQGSAELVAAAATPAFPPCTAILTAITFMLKASKDVSADYDRIISYFDVNNSFLERLSLLESKLPTVPAYQKILIRVFSSLIVIGGIATQYIQKKRFKKWVSALMEGSDDKLKSAYNTMEESIRRLESATMFATLANTQSIKSEARETLNIVTELRVEMRDGRMVTARTQMDVKEIKTDLKENVMVSQQGLMETQRIEATLKEMSEYLKQQERLNDKDPGKHSAPDPKAKDPNSRRHYALNQVKRAFFSSAKPVDQERDIADSFVEASSTWVFQEKSYSTWLSTQSSYLWLFGAAGIGKSCLAYSALRRLRDSFKQEERTSIAYFYFREEHEELRSVQNALGWIVIQTAEQSPSYCEQTAADLQQNGSDFGTDLVPIWERFFEKKFTKESDCKLYLVFDGLDEADANGRNTLLGLLAQIKEKGLNVHVLITSRPELRSAMNPLNPEVIEVTKSKITKDIQRLIQARLNTLSRLRTFRTRVKRRIVTRLETRADNMLYVEHMLRRLNSIGREGAVLREIEHNLPKDLESLYAVLLSECQRHRTPDQFKTLKRLFAWLAYSKRPLSFGEAKDLVSIMSTEGCFSIEEELQGKSARLLGFTAFLMDDMRPFENGESDSAEDEEESEEPDDDRSSPLKFQERSLREYFRAMDVDETGLRTSPSSAHLTIFEMISQMLSISLQKGSPEASLGLKSYAARFWAQHFQDISLGTISEEDLVRVVESLVVIITNHDNVAESIEACDVLYSEIFGDSTDRHEGFVDAISKCANLAVALDSGKLSRLAEHWVQDINTSPRHAMVLVARGHVLSWFQKVNEWEANRSFECARAALLMTDLVPALRETPLPLSADTVLLVSDAFGDIEKDSRAHRAVAIVCKGVGSTKAAENELEKSMEKAGNDLDRFYALVALAEVYEKSSQAGDSNTGNIYKTIDQALAIRPQIQDGDDSDNTASQIRKALLMRADFEQKGGTIDAAMKSYGEAREARPEIPLDGSVYNTISIILETKGQYNDLITKVESWTEFERLSWLVYQAEADEAHKRFQKAVKRSGKGENILISCYRDIIKFLDKYDNSNMARYYLAIAYRTVLKDNNQAKSILYSILDNGISTVPWTGQESAAIRCDSLGCLSDIIFEEFRSTSDPDRKAASLQEMKNFLSQSSLSSDRYMSIIDSQSAVVLAIMTKQIGLAAEFEGLMHKIFSACVEGLSDRIGWNDGVSLRLLAKCLACVTGLERDSQIAYSCCFSLVDPTLSAFHDDIGETDETKNDEKEINLDKKLKIEEKFDDKSEITGNDRPCQSEEDLDPESSLFCNGCNREFHSWTEALYYCILCDNCDLCGSCYQTLKLYDGKQGEDVTYCNRDHQHIKGPIVGWKGVKDGVIFIDKDKVKFDDWLTGLQDKRWKEAWKKFWKKNPVRDIV